MTIHWWSGFSINNRTKLLQIIFFSKLIVAWYFWNNSWGQFLTDTVWEIQRTFEKAALLGIYRVRSGTERRTDPVRRLRPRPGVCRVPVLPQYPNTVTRTELSNFLRSTQNLLSNLLIKFAEAESIQLKLKKLVAHCVRLNLSIKVIIFFLHENMI